VISPGRELGLLPLPLARNAMPFPGIPDQKERNDLIAYLEMLK
jgi:cytochrome c2